MLFIYILLVACASARKIHFLGAGKNHTPGHFHYKVSVPHAWDSSSSIEYLECASGACTSPVRIKKINITNLMTVTELQVQQTGNVYDIECDASCLEDRIYKYVKVVFKTATSENSEIVETCPGEFVSGANTCTQTCYLGNNKGVCTRKKMLCLRDEDVALNILKSTASSSCIAYDHTAPICSEGTNINQNPCRCFSSCSIDISMVPYGRACADGKNTVGAQVVINRFREKITHVESILTDYEFFYPDPPSRKWYETSDDDDFKTCVTNCYIKSNRNYEPYARECDEGLNENNDICKCTSCEQINVFMTERGETCRHGVVYSPDECYKTCSEKNATVLKQSIEFLENYIDSNGPFESILGVSKSVPMVLAYMAHRNPFNNAILLNGIFPKNYPTLIRRMDQAPPIKSTAAFIYLTNTNEGGKEFKEYFVNPEVIIHTSENSIPQNTNDTAVLNELDTFINLQNSETDGECLLRNDNVCMLMSCTCGYYINGNGLCEECPVGHSCDSLFDTVTPCPVGTFQNLKGQSSCQTCQIDTYQNETGQTECTQCSVGKYQNLVGQSECKTCESSGGCTVENCCEQCSAGKYKTTSQTACASCPIAKYQDVTGESSCKSCPTGTYSNQHASISCQSCQAGQHVNANNTACVDCVPGKYQDANKQTSCKDCPSGTFSNQDGASTCQDCQAGQHVNFQNTGCIDCTAGKYQDANKQTLCKNCLSGTFSNQDGASTCQDCQAGQHVNTANTACVDCVAGKYQNANKQTSCKQCQKGYCPTGAAQQLSCPAGNIIDTGRTSCTQCIEGKFQSSPNQWACTFCEVRKSRILDGTTGQPLLLGYYQDEKGQARCKRCDGSVSANLAGLIYAKCAATCKFAAKPHICPFKLELKPQGLLPSTCAKEKCTDSECCQENQVRKAKVVARATTMRTTLLAVFQTVGDADGRDDVGKATERTTVQNDIRFETRGDESEADALGRILGDVTDDIGAKSIEKIDEEVYEMTQEELQQERATERRKSPTEQRAKKEQEAVDVSSLKCKELMKNAEDIQNSVEKEKALVEVTKAMSIVKETIAEQQKQLRTATSSLANEDTLGVIVNTKDLPPRNPKLREKMEKGRLPFLKIKIPKDHTSVTDWANFDCSNADVNFDNIGIDDLEEVIIDTGEKAAACKNGKLVTYVETKQKNGDGYDIFNVYCCQAENRRRLGAGRKLIQRECVPKTHTARTIDAQPIADDEWISGDEYECADSGTYKHPVMSFGATFDGCFVQELLNETGWVYDSPGRTLGDCGSSQCTVNNTNVTCLYLGNSCRPSCEGGYESNGLPLTCSGGDLYSTSETNCAGCLAGKKATAGATTCSDCLAGQYSNALASQCTNCPTGWVSASDGSATCTDCNATGQYNANAGKTQCFSVPLSGTNYITRIDGSTLECQYGGTPVYSAAGEYDSGCNSPGIVMFGRAVIDDGNGNCVNKCVKWYSTAAGSNLVDGFIDPSNTGSFVIEVTNMATFCTYLWGSTWNIPRSDECP